MDAARFDALLRSLASGRSRRVILAGLPTLWLVVVGLDSCGEADAKRKKRKKKGCVFARVGFPPAAGTPRAVIRAARLAAIRRALGAPGSVAPARSSATVASRCRGRPLLAAATSRALQMD